MARRPVINQALEMVTDRLFRAAFWTAKHLDPVDPIDMMWPDEMSIRQPADAGLVHFAGLSFTFRHPDGRVEMRQRCGWCGHELIGETVEDDSDTEHVRSLPHRARVIKLGGIWWAAASGTFHDLPQRCIDTDDVLRHAWEAQ